MKSAASTELTGLPACSLKARSETTSRDVKHANASAYEKSAFPQRVHGLKEHIEETHLKEYIVSAVLIERPLWRNNQFRGERQKEKKILARYRAEIFFLLSFATFFPNGPVNGSPNTLLLEGGRFLSRDWFNAVDGRTSPTSCEQTPQQRRPVNCIFARRQTRPFFVPPRAWQGLPSGA